MQRFTRTRLFLGNEAFHRLSGSHVAVIGLGAVGGYAVEGLARAGIGRLTLADFDTIQISNINRQIYALESTLHQAKADAARRRIADINPACRVEALQLFADDQTISRVLDSQPDIVIDAIDSLNPKVQVITAAYHRGITVFSSMGAALRSDPALIRVDDISNTRNCPLARRLRKRLRANTIDTGITCVYSIEAVDFAYQYTEPSPTDPTPYADRGRQRHTLGSLPTLTGIFGLILANEVIKKLSQQTP